jgi:Zn-dependent protease with chaperone function
MLQIIAIIYLTRHNIKKSKEKGHSGALFGVLTVLLWLFFEFVGVFVAILAMEMEGLGLSLVGLVFAAVGGLISYLIVQALPNKVVSTPPPPNYQIPQDPNEPQWYKTNVHQQTPYTPPNASQAPKDK